MRTIKNIILVILLLSCCVMTPSPVWAGEATALVTIDALREQTHAMEQEAAVLEEENRGLMKMLKEMEDDDIYLVVDTESNRLTMRQRNRIILTAVVGTGSRQFVEEETGRNWYFETPTGSLTVLGKERNPVWIRPDWSYVEENMPVPPENDPDRIVRGVLGKYALILGNGYKIHGTKYTELLGTHFTHGCISVGDKDLEKLYRSVKIGTKVYIY
ncbi:MAG TPA: L,D-transpeptidase [Nitrospirota bacterium]|nr:L,D-transpeptidase [Nitrospirota bacterium]